MATSNNGMNSDGETRCAPSPPVMPGDKLTARSAYGQLIGGGCFSIALDRLRSRSAYQGQWSRLRFSV